MNRGSDWVTMGLANCADEASGQCDTCRASHEAPQIPIAEASTALTFSRESGANLSFLGDAIALRAMDVWAPIATPVRSGNPQGVSGVFRNLRVAFLGGRSLCGAS